MAAPYFMRPALMALCLMLAARSGAAYLVPPAQRPVDAPDGVFSADRAMMLDNILPVSARAEGLRSDSTVGKHLAPAPLESIHMPTLIISARDDRYGTYGTAKYTTSRISMAKFVGFDQGGHTWVGHDDEVMAEIVKLLVPLANP